MTTATRDGLRIHHLFRGTHSVERSAQATRRVLRLVASWGQRTELEVTIGATQPRRNAVTFTIKGVIPSGWVEDLKWALEDVAELRRCSTRKVPAPRFVAELRPSRDFAPLPAIQDPMDAHARDLAVVELSRQRELRDRTPWPDPRVADLADLLRFNAATAKDRLDLVLRYRLSAAAAVEEDMTGQAVRASWDPSRGDVHEYVGTPVRMRALVGSNLGPLPGRVEAVVRQWAGFIELVSLGKEASAAWSGEPLDIAGHAVPHGFALACVRLPVAGRTPFPGMRAADPRLSAVPLDPVPSRPTAGVSLGRATTADGASTDVQLSPTDLRQHMFIQGASGSGKTTLEAALATGLLDADCSFTFLDGGEGALDMILDRIPAKHAHKVHVVRHGDPTLNAPVNLLAAPPDKLERMVGLFAEMTQQALDPKQEGYVGPRWRRYFTLIALNLVAALGEDANIVSVAHISGSQKLVQHLARATRAIAPELSWQLESEYGNLPRNEATELASWGASKLQELLSSEAIRWILGCGPDALDIPGSMDRGESLLIDLGSHELGQTASRAIGAAYLLKHWAALGERTNRDRTHVIIVDEAHLLSYGPLPRLLAEARKFGVAVVVATQHLGQLPAQLADAVESNTGTFISLRSGLQSAQRASARLMGWPEQDLVRLPNLTGAASMTRDGLVTAPFTLNVDFHERSRRARQLGHVGDHVASRIESRSRQELAAYSELSPIRVVDLAERLDDARPKAPEESRSAVDAWLAKRKDERRETLGGQSGAPNVVEETAT